MEDPKNIKEELTEDELNGVSGGDGVVTDVPGNPLGSLKEELSDEELKGVSGGAVEFRDMSDGDVFLGEDGRGKRE